MLAQKQCFVSLEVPSAYAIYRLVLQADDPDNDVVPFSV